MKKLLTVFLFCILHYKTINAQNYRFEATQNKIYIDFASTENVDPDSVEYLVIKCDKLDSITSKITKFRNLKSLSLLPCQFTDANRAGKLNTLQKNLFLKKIHEVDSLNNIKNISKKQMFADWDSTYSVNKLVWVSKEIYNLKKLEFIDVSVNMNTKVKRFFKHYYRKTKICVMVKDSYKFCKQFN